MGNIVLLDELTINKIAAGEVIERPASVIKEMVENSIDAESTSITVEIKNGGISYIRITDNGKGIQPDDMEIAFERHATSKIRNAEDLEMVKSMGFRGEALASIAAISNVEMVSRTSDSEIGNKIVVEAGKILEKNETGCPVGTSITVTNLFFNTPVRYKFLKKDFTEAGYIEDAITRLALVNPKIAFKLVNSGKTIIQTTGNGDKQAVIYSIYGKDIAQGVIPVDYVYEDIQVVGVIGKPEIARSNRSYQLFFVNERYVKDKTLSSAAEKAFQGLLPIGKYGFLSLNIKVPVNKVDANVHPAKLEVRFEEEQKVFKAVYHAIKDTLLKTELVATTVEGPEKEISAFPSFSEKIQKENRWGGLFGRNGKPIKEEKKVNSELKDREELDKNQEINDKQAQEVKEDLKVNPIVNKLLELQQIIQEELEASKQEEDLESTKTIDLKKMLEQLEEAKASPDTANFDEMYMKMFGKLPSKEEIETKEVAQNEVGVSKLSEVANFSLFEETEKYQAKPNYKFIGIAFQTYIIIEIEEQLYLLDQHAAHERIMYEKVKKNFYDEKQKDSQLMILPDIITLTHKEMGIAKDNMELFERAGFILEEFGDNTIKISGTPSICINLDTKELFLETLDEINTVARTAKQEIEEKFIATIACKAAVKAKMSLDKQEVESLLDELLVLPNPFTCPHGRPTAIKMAKNDMEKKFSRR